MAVTARDIQIARQKAQEQALVNATRGVTDIEAEKAAAQATLASAQKALADYNRSLNLQQSNFGPPGSKGARNRQKAARGQASLARVQFTAAINTAQQRLNILQQATTVEEANRIAIEQRRSGFETLRPSSPANAVGGGQLGGSDRGGTVISTSTTEDIQRERDFATSRGFTPTARLDPRSAVLEPTEDGGIFDTRTTAKPSERFREAAREAGFTPTPPQQTPRTTPQRARAQTQAEAERIETEVPSYENIGFVKDGQKPRNVLDEFVDTAERVTQQAAGVLNPLPEAFAETPQDNQARIQKIKDTIAKARQQGAKEITIVGEAGFEKIVPIDSALREIIAAGREQDVTVRAQGAGRREIFLDLEESLSITSGTGGGRTADEIIDLANQPRQITATSLLQREEKKTGLDLSILAPVTEFLDREFELGTPKELRSQKPRQIPGVPKEVFSGISNREIAETFAPVSNFAADVFDLGKVAGGAVTGQVKFKTPTEKKEPGDFSNILNLPVPTPETFQRLPKQRTALTDVLEGKPVDFSKSTSQVSLAGEALFLGGIDKAFRASIKGAEKVSGVLTKAKDIKQIRKELEPARVPPTTATEPLAAVESAVSPKARTQEIVPSLLQNIIGKPKTTPGKIKVTPVKGQEGLYDIEGTVPGAERLVTARKVGKQEFVYETLESPATAGGKPTGIDVLGAVGKAEQKEFGLIPTTDKSRFVTKGAGKPDLAEQLASDIVKPVARQKTFTAQQVKEAGPEFGAFFFGKARPGYTPISTPLSDILLFETRSSRLVGTRVGTKKPLPDSPSGFSLRPTVFEGIRDTKLRLRLFGGEKFTKRQVTDTFVSDVRIGSKGFVDPFADLTKYQRTPNMLERILGIKPQKGKSLSRGQFAIDAGIDKPLTGRAKAITTQELKGTQERLLPKQETQKPKSDVFGPIPIVDTDTPSRGGGYATITEYTRSLLEPTSITERRPRLEQVERIRSERVQDIEKLAFGGGSDMVDPLGQVSPARGKGKERNLLKDFLGIDTGVDTGSRIAIIPISGLTPRISEKPKGSSARRTIDLERIREEIIPIEGIIQSPRLKQPPINTTIQGPTFFPPTRLQPPRTVPGTEFFFPRGAFPFLFPGGGGFDGGRKGRGDKSFTVFSVGDIGVLEQVGIPSIQTSKSPDIFQKIDIQLERATGRERKRKKSKGIFSGLEIEPIGRATNFESVRIGRQLGRTKKSTSRSLRNPQGSKRKSQRSRRTTNSFGVGKKGFRF